MTSQNICCEKKKSVNLLHLRMIKKQERSDASKAIKIQVSKIYWESETVPGFQRDLDRKSLGTLVLNKDVLNFIHPIGTLQWHLIRKCMV